jgi:tetratricopeptide (TPR) repeat protein
VRRFPSLAIIDLGTITKEREAEVKGKIISDRLGRKISKAWRIFLNLARPVLKFSKIKFGDLYERVLILEKHYQEKGSKLLEAKGLDLKIKLLFNEAEELAKKDNPLEAEKRYIEIISLDKKNLRAYEKLGNLYLSMRKQAEAEEIFNFILKYNPSDASVLVSLGELVSSQGNPAGALNYFERAVAIRPNNPKYLDFLIETSIITGNKDLARKTLDRLAQVNPDNQKLLEFKKRIGEL